jgi:acyl-ACP thioesterase
MVVVQCHKQPNAKIQTLSFLSVFYRNKNPEVFGSATDFMITSALFTLMAQDIGQKMTVTNSMLEFLNNTTNSKSSQMRTTLESSWN